MVLKSLICLAADHPTCPYGWSVQQVCLVFQSFSWFDRSLEQYLSTMSDQPSREDSGGVGTDSMWDKVFNESKHGLKQNLFLSGSFSVYLTFLLFPKHTSEEVNGTSMLILTPLLYSPFYLLPIILWDWLKQASLFSPLIDVLIFPEDRRLGVQPLWEEGTKSLGEMTQVFEISRLSSWLAKEIWKIFCLVSYLSLLFFPGT